MDVRMFARRAPWCSVLFTLAGVTAVGGCTRSEEDVRAEELAELRRQRLELVERFGLIQAGIRQTQGAALDHPGVQAAQDSFQTRLLAYARSEDPDALPLLERSAELGADYERMSGQQPVFSDQPVTADEQIAVAGEIQSVERALRPHLQRAMLDPSVRAAFMALQDSLVQEMNRLDPDVSVTLRRMEETAERIRQIDLRIAELEGGTGA